MSEEWIDKGPREAQPGQRDPGLVPGGKRGQGWRDVRAPACLGTFAKAKEAAGSSEGAGRGFRELRQQDLICCKSPPPRHQGRGLEGQGGTGQVEEAAARPRTLPQAWK